MKAEASGVAVVVVVLESAWARKTEKAALMPQVCALIRKTCSFCVPRGKGLDGVGSGRRGREGGGGRTHATHTQP